MKLVDTTTGEVVTPLDKQAARELTERIKSSAEALWALLYEAHQRQAWKALGYPTWEKYITAEFHMGRRHSYRLLDQAIVIKQIESVSHGTQIDISERNARDLKPHLTEVTDAVARATNGAPTSRKADIVREVVRQERERIAKRQRDKEELAAFVEEFTPEGFDVAANDREIAVRQTFFGALDELLALDVAELIPAIRPYQEHHVDKVRPAIEWLRDFEKQWRNR